MAADIKDWYTIFFMMWSHPIPAKCSLMKGSIHRGRHCSHRRSSSRALYPVVKPDSAGNGLWQTQLQHGTRNRAHHTKSIPTMLLLSNAPQILLILGYILYNRVLTGMALAAENNSFAPSHKPLCLTWPKGTRRSTYFLAIPYGYSIPILVASTISHW